MKAGSGLAVWIAWGVLAIGTSATAWPQFDSLGLYYDEAFLAQQARDFVEPERAGVHPPSVTTAVIAGRPFPVRNAAYLGSLKSQLTIPGFALFGANVRVLRATTLAIGLLGLLFFMLWIRVLFGNEVALIAGGLTATDPSFYFFSQFEWGPFTSMLLCRAAGLYWLYVGYHTEKTAVRWSAWLGAAVAMGLGIYSRVDFAVILAGLGCALLAVRRDIITQAWRERRAQLGAATAVFLLCIVPVAVVVGDVLGASAGISGRGDFLYRLHVLTSTLDGSHFHRLIEAGGLFDDLFAFDAPRTPLGLLAVIASLALLVLTRGVRTGSGRCIPWLLVATLAIGLAMLAIPGAVRGHHMLNLLPLPHLIVAAAGVALWRHDWSSTRARSLARTCAGLALAATILANVSSIEQTRNLIHETGGKGRWSSALQHFAAELDRAPDAQETEVVSLDWGFHEPLLFTTNHIALDEPIWTLAETARRRGSWRRNGDRNTVYLFHSPPYDLFGYGEAFSRTLRIHASRAKIREHRDQKGLLAFKSARLDAPHHLDFDGSFRIRWSEAGPRPPAPVAPR